MFQPSFSPRIGWRKAKAMSCKHLLLIYGTENTESFVLIVLVAYGWSFQIVSYPKIVLFIGILSMTISASSGIFEARVFPRKNHDQVSSVQGFFGLPGRTAYAAAKHAALGFYDSLRAEVADRGYLYKRDFFGKTKGETTRSSLKPSQLFQTSYFNTFKSLICWKSQGDFNIEHPQ